ncbi:MULTISPECIES: TonB-dependent siderophore receptor [unclassified Bradyrhizobium]|uniref:TonB-dependent siderophore receptor n=1 Tax=unclassified Bradyrhizobium TaxID=2631580 RepID=UPI002479921F|nr:MULTISPECIES: TonB-dependent siderophore receptor [unclassified Bradyrhizobium]WGS18187.1 TonB-dependent siderophore receptor [Bradyrhizobium sp. ISRA463]WGS25001.1 TonB-dependent siderophore receptor [Bradyrhizobium sp. ISRA464]
MNHSCLLRIAASATASALALLPHSSFAQGTTTSSQQSGARALPPVVVASPETRRRTTTAAPRRIQRAARPAASQKPPPVRNVGLVESPRGPIQGYVAHRSSSGTKTNTPIMETPQSVSVVGSEQIRDQKPGKFDETLRYSAGVLAGTFGADTRNDWFLIRGFKSDDVGLFLDGMQLFYTSYASWKLQPFDLERVEVLRGPSAVLYGGSSPSGIVNAISKMPPAEPIRYIETGVNNFGNAYVGFDVGGPVATQSQDGKLFYRVVGQVQNGGTQVNFTPDNNYFIAPSVTYKPDADTTFTVLASASRNETRGINFLPYVGTVTNAPFGRIPTSLFVGDPSIDTFTREQEMLGYQFERNLSDNVTFRQNARFAHVDVTYRGLVGNGYTDMAAGDLGRYNWYAKDTANQANLDNQLEYRFDTGPVKHTMLFGLDLRDYRIDDYQNFQFGTTPSLNVFNPVYGLGSLPFTSAPFRNYLITQEQLGTYLQDQMKLGRFTLVLSGRNDWVSTSQGDRPSGVTLYNREDSKFSGRAGLIYNFDNGVAPYVSYATSYNPVIGLNASNQLLLPETGQQTEVGVKVEPKGFDGHFTFAWFDLKRQNALTTDPNNPLLQNQTGEVTSRGFEVEAVANPLPGLKLIGALTTYDLFTSKDLNPALIGKTPTNTPQQMASIRADYTIQQGPLTGFGFGGGVRYVGSSFADQANTLEVPSVVLGDAAIHYEWQGWRAALNVVNIADTIYVASCAGTTSCFYGDRRRITASLGYKW